MRRYILSVAAVMALGVSPGAAVAGAANTLSSISISEDHAGAEVRIKGSAAPSFTQFVLSEPRRVVIDLSDALLAGPAREIPGDGRLVRGIRTSGFRSATTSVARVTVELTGSYPYQLEADGGDLVLRVEGSAGPQRWAAKRPAAPEAPAVSAPAAQDEAPAPALADAEAEASPALAQGPAPEVAAEEATATRAEAARKRAEDEAAAAKAQARESELALAKALEEVQAKERAIQAAEARAEAERQAKLAAMRRERDAQVMRDAQEGVTPGVRYALLQTDEMPGAAESGQVRVSAAPKVMGLVGFQQQPEVSRVFIRTNEPVRYSVSRSSEDTIVVEIENTRAATGNDLNFLDTRFFDTAIAHIGPQEIEGAGTHMRIVITLKQAVPYEVNQVDNEIHVDFRRPGR